MPSIEDLNDELLRTRGRLHKLESGIAALALRMDLLTGEQRTVQSRQDEILDQLRKLSTADEVSAAVHDALDARGPSIALHDVWKVTLGSASIAVGLLSVLDAIHHFWH